MFFALILSALAEDRACTPTATDQPNDTGPQEYHLLIPVAHVSRVEQRDAPAMACHAGASGGYEVTVLTEQVNFLYVQLADRKKASCGSYKVEVTAGYGVCSSTRGGGSELCTDSSGTTATRDCMSREEALRQQVARLEACPGITPAPRPSNIRVSRVTVEP